MNKLEKAKEVIKENYHVARFGIYDCADLFGDTKGTLFDRDNLKIDICYDYGYFEVFGLTDAEFAELEKYYEELGAN